MAPCAQSSYGCCPDGLTARTADDDDCLTSTSNARPTPLHSPTSSHATSPVMSPSQATVATTTVATETSSSATTVAETTTARVVSSSHPATRDDESEAHVTSSAGDREPAYSMTSSLTDDVTTVMTSKATPTDDARQRGECLRVLSHSRTQYTGIPDRTVCLF